jgi:hypothetical protein
MARVTGLEPATSGVTGRHSNRLSYTRLSSHASGCPGTLSNRLGPFDVRLTKGFVFGCQAGLRTKQGSTRNCLRPASFQELSGDALPYICIYNVEGATLPATRKAWKLPPATLSTFSRQPSPQMGHGVVRSRDVRESRGGPRPLERTRASGPRTGSPRQPSPAALEKVQKSSQMLLRFQSDTHRSRRPTRRAISSVGRAPRLHRGCREFESLIAHHSPFLLLFIHFFFPYLSHRRFSPLKMRHFRGSCLAEDALPGCAP